MELLQGFRNEAVPLPSATVVLLRDGASGLEVFLVRRHASSDVLGSAYVFPGGKVDAADGGWLDSLDQSPAELRDRLGEDELDATQAAALFAAAVRELFEETGLLYAPLPDAEAATAWQALRGGRRFAELFPAGRLRLAASRLQPWSRWVTPVVSSVSRKRFDARFFLGTVPDGRQPSHDEREATASVWLSPRDALRQYWGGAIELAPPQIMSLAHLARHGSVADAFAAAQARRPPCIRTEPIELAGERVLCYPGDPAHPLPEQLLPGPTRLRWRNRRFEPDGGLAILLGD